MTKKLKRWTLLDSLNAILLIVVIFFFLDFQDDSMMSWILIAVFAFWLITVILRNTMISKIAKDPQHPLHNIQTDKNADGNVKK